MTKSKIFLFLKLLVIVVIVGGTGYYFISNSTMGPSKAKTVTISTGVVKEAVKDEKNIEIIKKEVLENQKDIAEYGQFLDDENIIIGKKIKATDPMSKPEKEAYNNASCIYILNLNTLKEERVSEDENPKKFSCVYYIE